MKVLIIDNKFINLNNYNRYSIRSMMDEKEHHLMIWFYNGENDYYYLPVYTFKENTKTEIVDSFIDSYINEFKNRITTINYLENDDLVRTTIRDMKK